MGGLAVDPVRARFSDADWYKYLNEKVVTVVGAGGIGSWVTMCLSRIGCHVHLFDADRFEVHNMGGQLVRATDIGRSKVEAVAEMCESLVGASCRVSSVPYMYDDSGTTSPIMISAVDSMKARKLIFEKWAKVYGDKEDAIYIDGRLLAEDYQVLAVTKGSCDAYRETIVDDNSIPTENCTLKSTTHCSLGIASDIIGILTNFAANLVTKERDKIEVRDVPFKIVKSIPNFMYEIHYRTTTEATVQQGILPLQPEESEVLLLSSRPEHVLSIPEIISP